MCYHLVSPTTQCPIYIANDKNINYHIPILKIQDYFYFNHLNFNMFIWYLFKLFFIIVATIFFSSSFLRKTHLRHVICTISHMFNFVASSQSYHWFNSDWCSPYITTHSLKGASVLSQCLLLLLYHMSTFKTRLPYVTHIIRRIMCAVAWPMSTSIRFSLLEPVLLIMLCKRRY